MGNVKSDPALNLYIWQKSATIEYMHELQFRPQGIRKVVNNIVNVISISNNITVNITMKNVSASLSARVISIKSLQNESVTTGNDQTWGQ